MRVSNALGQSQLPQGVATVLQENVLLTLGQTITLFITLNRCERNPLPLGMGSSERIL
jgi:hypothetical protein